MSIMSSMLVVPSCALVIDASIGNGLIIPEAATPLAMDAVAGAEAWVVETGSGDKR